MYVFCFPPRHDTRYVYARVYTALSACTLFIAFSLLLPSQGRKRRSRGMLKISFAFVLALLYDGRLYRVYVQVFPDKARRREVGLIQVHCDDVRCSWTGNASKLEVPTFFQATRPAISFVFYDSLCGYTPHAGTLHVMSLYIPILPLL